MSTIIKFELKELRKLASDKDSCVLERSVTQNLALQPWCLGNLKDSIKNLLDYKIGKFDKEFNGILLSFKNLRILQNVGTIRNDNADIHFQVQADYFIFRPRVGATLRGIVNKKSLTHLGVLVHRVFNVVIPRPTEEPGNKWLGSTVQEGQEVVFRIAVLDLFGALPYIRGELDEKFLQYPSDIDGDGIKHKYVDPLNVSYVNFDKTKPNYQKYNNDDSLQQTPQKSTEQSAQRTSQNNKCDSLQQTPQNSAEQSAQRTSHKNKGDSLQQTPQKSAEQSAQRTSHKNKGDSLQQTPQKSAERNAQRTSHKNKSDSLQQTPQKSAERNAQRTSHKNKDDSLQQTPQKSAEQNAQRTSQKNKCDSPQQTPQKSAEQNAQRTSQKNKIESKQSNGKVKNNNSGTQASTSKVDSCSETNTAEKPAKIKRLSKIADDPLTPKYLKKNKKDLL